MSVSNRFDRILNNLDKAIKTNTGDNNPSYTATHEQKKETIIDYVSRNFTQEDKDKLKSIL